MNEKTKLELDFFTWEEIKKIFFNKKFKNVILFSQPRSGSTFVSNLLSKELNYSENFFQPFSIRSEPSEMKTLTKAFKIFFRFVAPLALVLLYVLKTIVLPGKRPLEIMYTISLSACVGYFTNFIAIKMLFRPKEETFF